MMLTSYTNVVDKIIYQTVHFSFFGDYKLVLEAQFVSYFLKEVDTEAFISVSTLGWLGLVAFLLTEWRILKVNSTFKKTNK